MKRVVTFLFAAILLCTNVLGASCENPNCKCDPCKCDPCKCDVELTQSPGQCPGGQCPAPQAKPDIEKDIRFVHRAYAASARLSHSRSGGSATVIDCYKNRKGEWVAILLGCNHVVDYGEVTDLKVELFWPSKIEMKGYVVERDPTADLSLMSAIVPNQVPSVPIARSGSPKEGEVVLTIGCPALDNKQSDPVGYFTPVTGATYTDTNGNNLQYSLNYPAVGGHSGGGVFNSTKRHVGVLVSRGKGHSQVVPAETSAKFYERIFCEGSKLQKAESKNEPTCLFDFFRRRQPRPPYQGPPQGGAPDLTPEPEPVVVPEPEPDVVPQAVIEDNDSVSPVVTGLMLSIPAGIGALAICFIRKVKGTASLYS